MAYEVPLRIAAYGAAMYFLAVTLFNLVYLRRTKKTVPFMSGPLVSVILPARNEEEHIAACLDHLTKQVYANIEIIVVDDNSEDATGIIARSYASKDDRITVIEGRHLPAGWNGKQFACSQAVKAARGELLFMTDADVRHGPESVGFAVANLYRKKADYLSGYVHQEIGSIGEALIVPMTYIMTSLLLPIPILTSRFFPSWGFGIGQYMLARKESFKSMGGYEEIKDSLVEDMAMARAMKQSEYKTVFIDAEEVASCRMYQDYRSAFQGFAKSLFGATGGRALVVSLLAAVVLFFVLLPFYRLLEGIYAGEVWQSNTVVPPALFFAMWILTLTSRGLKSFLALLYPLSFFNIILIAISSTMRTGFGKGIEWKGRLVRCGRPDLPDPEILNVVGLFRLASFFVYTLVLTLVILFDKIAYGLRVRGRGNLLSIKGGFFLISNHSLYLDPAVVAHAVFPRRTYFTALEETFSFPFVGGLIRLLGAFPLPRESCMRRIMPVVEWALDRGKCVHFFPEGELYHYNRDPAEFNEGVFYLAERFNVPVVPVTLAVRPRRIFSKELPQPFVRVTVRIGEALYPGEFEGAGSGSRKDLIQAMTREARNRVADTIRSYTG